MLELTTIQGTTAPAAPQQPAIPPVPSRPGAATGATAAPGTPAQTAAEIADQAAQAARDAVNQELTRVQQTGQTEISIPPPYRGSNNDIPPEVIPLVGMIGGMLMTVILGYPIIRFIIKMIERKTDRSVLPAKDVAVQLRALQDSVDTMAIELERISEGQRFTAKLMAEKEKRALGEGQAR